MSRVDDILQTIAGQTGVSVSELRGPRRHDRVSQPRQRAMAELRAAGFTLNQIGRFLGRRHHTTVLFGIEAHQRRLGHDLSRWNSLGSSREARP